MHCSRLAAAVAVATQLAAVSGGGFRPPAIPLITTDPFFQTWLFGSAPTDDVVRHWDGRVKQMMGLARIDGVAYRWLGACVNDPTEVLGATRRVENVELDCGLLTYTVLSGVGQQSIDRCNRICYADPRCLA